MPAISSSASNAFYKAIFDGCSDAIYIIDPETSSIRDGNPAAWLELGMSKPELLESSVIALQNDVLDMRHWCLLVEQIRNKQPFTFIGRHWRKDGSVFPVEVYTSVVWYDERELFISIARNLHTTSLQREEFREKDAKLTYALNEAVDGMWDWQIDTGEVFFSPQLKRMLGYLPHEMDARIESWSDAVHTDDRERVMALMDDHLKGSIPHYEADYRLHDKEGRCLWVRDRGRVCEWDKEGAAKRIVGMVHDITAAKALEDQLRQQANYDHLTGLLNRRAGYIHFRKQLGYAQRYTKDFTLSLVDLDHFKGVNDAYGHLVGDQVLKHFVSLINDSLRQSDTLMRWGGEEFLLLLPNTDVHSGKQLVEKLKDKVQAHPVVIAGRNVYVTISAGLACYPLHALDMDGLISSADDALYGAKTAGRNRVVVSNNRSHVKQQELFEGSA
ncbi:MAG: diguanylate cyclase [Amphritea sp.]